LVAALILGSALVVVLGCGEDRPHYGSIECCRVRIVC